MHDSTQSARVVIRLVGGPADGFICQVPEANYPRFVGIGQPIARYEPDPSNGEVRIFRYAAID